MSFLMRNIDLRITNEELEYGMGFLMDVGASNTPASNCSPSRSLKKQYVGYKSGAEKFYFEDKNYSAFSHPSNEFSFSKIMGYQLINTGSALQLTMKFKKGFAIAWTGFFTSLYIVGFVISYLMVDKKLIPVIIFSSVGILAVCFVMLWLTFLISTTRSDIKKTIETRLRIREYHRQKSS